MARLPGDLTPPRQPRSTHPSTRLLARKPHFGSRRPNGDVGQGRSSPSPNVDLPRLLGKHADRKAKMLRAKRPETRKHVGRIIEKSARGAARAAIASSGCWNIDSITSRRRRECSRKRWSPWWPQEPCLFRWLEPHGQTNRTIPAPRARANQTIPPPGSGPTEQPLAPKVRADPTTLAPMVRGKPDNPGSQGRGKPDNPWLPGSGSREFRGSSRRHGSWVGAAKRLRARCH